MIAIEEQDLESYPANIVHPDTLPDVLASTLANQLAILDSPEIET